jgi:hypothetical protein
MGGQISKPRFDALATWSRAPGTRSTLMTKSYWSSDDQRVIGSVYHVEKPDCFGYILLRRASGGAFYAFENVGAFLTAREAEKDIALRLKTLEREPEAPLLRPRGSATGIDLFQQIPKAKLNQKYKHLRDSQNQSAARELLREIAHWVTDLDGNFVRDFQTTGYDSRIWELYLFCAFTELDFEFDRSSAVPDFRLKKGDAKLFVEAVTANPTGNVIDDMDGKLPKRPENFWHYLEHEMPQKYGSPLLSKMKKKYWSDKAVEGSPFAFAIADFHSPGSMTWSHTALSFYLYGMGVEVRNAPDGRRFGVEKPLGPHVVGNKIVPTNFFGQDAVRPVSAIIFSNAGTIAKFNRMGVLAGFGDSNVRLVREGGLYDYDPNALEPIPFAINVEDPEYNESWADELEVYHNPRALNPLPHEMIPGATHFFLEDNELMWHGPERRILFSNTRSIVFPSGKIELPSSKGKRTRRKSTNKP